MKKLYIKGALLALLVVAVIGCGKKQDYVVTQVTKPIFIAEGVREVSINKQDREVMHIVYNPQEYEASFEHWKMKVPYGDEVVVDTEEALKIYQQLVMMDMQMEVAPDGVKEDFEDPLGKIKINFCQTTEEERASAVIGQETDKTISSSYQMTPDSTATLLIGGNDGQGNYYVGYEGDKSTIFLLDEAMVNVILDINPFNYILKISAIANKETMKSITIKMDGQTHKLSEAQLEEQVYRTLYTDILSVFVIEEIPDVGKVGKETILRIECKRNVKGAPDLHISYHPWDDEKYAVTVNKGTYFLVNSADVDELKAKITEAFAE